MQKPNKIVAISTPKDIEGVDNLFSILFQSSQDKEHMFREFSGTGVWPAAAVIPEKQIILCYNSTDAEYRIYTKIKGDLKYLVFT